MDTTSNAMARTLQLLAEHPQVQMKLRREIVEAKAAGNHLDYDQLHALPYLDAVCRETLRLYAAFHDPMVRYDISDASIVSHPIAPMIFRQYVVTTYSPLFPFPSKPYLTPAIPEH